MFYGLTLKKVDNGFEVSCRDLPECVYKASTKEEAMNLAGQMVPGTMILFYRKKRDSIPLPSPLQPGEIPIYVPLKLQAKILFWNYMVENRYRIADVAKELGVAHSEAARLVNLEKDVASIDAIENALRKIGGSFDLSVSK